MKLTVALKAAGAARGWWNPDADETTIRQKAAEKLVSGELSPDELAKFSREAPPKADRLAALEKRLADQDAEIAALKAGKPQPRGVDQARAEANAEAYLASQSRQDGTKAAGASPADIYRQAAGQGSSLDIPGGANIEFIKAAERYDTSRKSLSFPQRLANGGLNPLAGQHVSYQGRNLESASERDKAVACAWLKATLLRQSLQGMHHLPPALRMTDHEKDLYQWAIRNSRFVGGYGGDPDGKDGALHEVNRRKLTDSEVAMLDLGRWTKAPLIDDNTSGGSNLVPVEFDDAVITIPLLFGQLFPYVEVIDIARGSHVQGGSIGNPSFGYTAEGTQVTPFDATSYVGQFNNTIYPSIAAMQIGRDFQQDSPANIGQLVIDAFGRASMNWLDNVIANGNGSNQPQGILQFASPIVFSAENPTSGPLVVADLEGMKFALPLEYRNAEGGRNVYLGNDVNYSRITSIPRGSDDQMRVFGMKQDYTVFDWPYRVNNTVPNNQLASVNLGYYRLYRRLGMTTVVDRTGYTLQTSNTDLIVCRMRWGGKMKLGNAVALCSNFPN
jgi:HK97 family phage major capsid protein